jgi:Xaa-Pro aminopeptidase
MRSATIGPPTDVAKRLTEGCLAALSDTQTAMRPGATFDEVARLGPGAWRGRGYRCTGAETADTP